MIVDDAVRSSSVTFCSAGKLVRTARAIEAAPSLRLQKKRRGATTVEFALAAPIWILMVLGIFEFGHQLMVAQLLTDAARKGCRLGIIEGTSTQQIKDAAVNYLTSLGISGDTAQVTINDGVGNIVEAQNVAPYTEITVVVSVPTSSTTWMPSGLQVYLPGVGSVNVGPSGTLSGQFTMRRE